MEQIGKVTEKINDKKVKIAIARKGACSADCEKCGGCAHPEQIMEVEVGNEIGAKVGDQVVLRSASQKILSIAALVYLMPLLLMIGAYFLPGPAGEGFHILFSFVGLGIGIAICMAYSRKVKKSAQRLFEIERIVGER